MTTNTLARTDTNGTTWYPALPFGWTSNFDFAAPHVLADALDTPAVVIVPAAPAAVVTTALRTSHAACSHATTPAARKVCRAARAK